MSTSVTSLGEREMLITRTFNAPRSLVFEANTKPELVKRWLGVRNGWIVAECEIDLRVGGRYRYVWRQEAKGKQMASGGEFREIAVPELTVFTEVFEDPWYPGEGLVFVTYSETGGKTLMTMRIEYPTEECRDMVMKSGMERGMEESYAVLDVVLATLA